MEFLARLYNHVVLNCPRDYKIMSTGGVWGCPHADVSINYASILSTLLVVLLILRLLFAVRCTQQS